MLSHTPRILTAVAVLLSAAALTADDTSPDDAKAGTEHAADVSAAIRSGLNIIQTAARNYPQHRDCFSCHHQALPVFAMVTAQRAGCEIDEELLTSQLEFTRESFAGRQDAIREGKRIGGQSATVSYAMWMFDEADTDADSLTDAMVAWLLARQEDDGRWQPQSHRPPLEESAVTSTAFAAYAMEQYAPEDSRDDVAASIERAADWLQTVPPVSHEDRVFRLWGLLRLGRDEVYIDSSRVALLKTQRDDGGWGQTDEMDSDAYATGQAVHVLLTTGTPPDDAAIRRGIDYLLQTQEADGSWHVVTRSKPIQRWFDNGDPHGTDQFISIPATCWAVAALAEWTAMSDAAAPAP